jgi:prepilin-type N-terminal cleavage/methylation domain-containing protein
MSNKQSAISNQLSAISKQSEKTPNFFKQLFTVHFSLFTDKKGFTMVELMVTMVIFVLAIAAASQIFTKLLTQFKQQSKVAETNIEGIVGLDLLRQDIEHAGLGLPWNIAGVAYPEAVDPTYNDPPGNPPSAIMSWILADNSDYLVIRSANATTSNTAGKSTHLTSDGNVRTWSLYTDDLVPNPVNPALNPDLVIVLSPGSTASNSRSLVVSGGTYYTAFNNLSSFKPADNTDVRLVYGISPANATNALRAPFNRADYYISAANVPTRCAIGTGVLVKATLLHAATLDHVAGELDEMPILDCVADLQVIYDLDTDINGTIDPPTNDISALSPQNIRDQLKNVQVYILAHEGQKDTNFTFNNFTAGGTSVRVGRFAGLGNDFDLTDIADYLNYRWKVYNISVETGNLR